MKLPKQLINFWAADHSLYFITTNYIYDVLLLANVYIHISKLVIR